MNTKSTKKYYEELNNKELCQCNYCLNDYEEIRKEYPELAQYLRTLGIDIQKPFETMPLEVDNKENANEIRFYKNLGFEIL